MLFFFIFLAFSCEVTENVTKSLRHDRKSDAGDRKSDAGGETLTLVSVNFCKFVIPLSLLSIITIVLEIAFYVYFHWIL